MNEPSEKHAHCFQSLYKAGGSGLALFMQYQDKSHLSRAIQCGSCVQAPTVSCIVCSLRVKALEFVAFVVRVMREINLIKLTFKGYKNNCHSSSLQVKKIRVEP